MRHPSRRRPLPALPLVAAPLLVVLTVALAAASLTPSAPAGLDVTITGTVTADGRALAGANVSVDGTAIGTSTDGSGRFRLTGVPDDAEAVRVTATGYAPVVEPIRGRTDLRIALREAPAEVAEARDDRTRGSAGEADLTGPPPPPPSPSAPMMMRDAAPATGAARSESAAGAPAMDGEMSAPADEVAAPEPPGRRRPTPRPGLLTAGDIDDGLNWAAFQRYVARMFGRQSGLPALDLDQRLTLQVVDGAGRGVAGARVRVEAEGGRRARTLVTETGTDGRLALFPSYDFGPGVRRLQIVASAPGAPTRSASVRVDRLDEDRTVRVALPVRRAERPNALDLAFVIDVTGSMGDELTYLTREFESIVQRIRRQHRGVDLRFGLVAYRDQGDAFVVRRFDFTRSVGEMEQRLASLRAGGGGDYPEAMDEALDAALDLDWRTGTAGRMAFLVADAPPHTYAYDATMAHVREARARGIRLYPLAASGVADEAEYIMRSAAALTQARHLFLTDDSGVGLPHAEPRIPCYDVTALDDLLVRVVASELAGRRVEADRDSIVRQVGRQQAGVCTDGEQLSQRPPQNDGRRGGDLGYD